MTKIANFISKAPKRILPHKLQVIHVFLKNTVLLKINSTYETIEMEHQWNTGGTKNETKNGTKMKQT